MVSLMSTRITEVRLLKPGNYFLIDGEPCKVVSIEKSKPGKHGSAKANIVAIGFFDGRKRNVVMPVNRKVETPVIEKKNAQVISLTPTTVQIMDSETYETFEVEQPEDEEVKSKIEPGVNVEYWVVMGKPIIMRVR